jgi:hypothetical protein
VTGKDMLIAVFKPSDEPRSVPDNFEGYQVLVQTVS